MDHGLFENQLERFVDYCRDHLDFSIEDMKYYSCLPICILDAVFKAGSRQNGSNRTIGRFCQAFDIPCFSSNPGKIPSREGQLTVRQVMEIVGGLSLKELADRISTSGKTSSKSGVQKTEAFLKWLDILELYEVQTYQDFHEHLKDGDLERTLRSIFARKKDSPVDYFYMIAGKPTEVRVDKIITAFVCEALDEPKVPATTIRALFKEAVKVLAPDHPGLTVKWLEHIVWEDQRKN
ncbi:MAG: hypothetical protein IKW89_12595 [Bacteroidales bacterium]|nr:hypothetical protein [Bacteroidales bacterium]